MKRILMSIALMVTLSLSIGCGGGSSSPANVPAEKLGKELTPPTPPPIVKKP